MENRFKKGNGGGRETSDMDFHCHYKQDRVVGTKVVPVQMGRSGQFWKL